MAERRERRPSIRCSEAGFSLVELMVAMAIFTIFIVIVLGSVVAISRSGVRTQLVGQSTNSSLVVFGSIDRQVRYADSINFPGRARPAIDTSNSGCRQRVQPALSRSAISGDSP